MRLRVSSAQHDANTVDEDALRAIRAASTALQERWPEGESHARGKASRADDRVQAASVTAAAAAEGAAAPDRAADLTNLDLGGCTQLEVLPPRSNVTALTDLTPGQQLKGAAQIGQLTAHRPQPLRACWQLKKLPPQIGQLTASPTSTAAASS